MGKLDSADVDAINSMRKQGDAAWEAGDLESFLDTFTDDVVWMPPSQPDLIGKEACRSLAKGLLDQTNFEQVATPSEEIVVAGDWAFDRFRVTWVATPSAGGESSQSNFRGFRVLRRQEDSSWKIARYIWN